jgi:mono/diheme cytochrome c family protein
MRGTLGVLGIVLMVMTSLAQQNAPQTARGEYIVNNVANCIQCHTPRSADGELDRIRLLQGAPIPLASPWPNQRWAVRAPHIAGLPGFQEEDVVSILTKGARLNGRKPQPPMPQFHLNAEDAQAVVAYLRSLR